MKGLTGYIGPSWGVFGALTVAVLLCCARPVCAQASVTFPDPKLEAAVRSALGRPSGPLTTDDLGALTALYTDWRHLTNYTGLSQIKNLSGLEHATNLMTLSLSINAIEDLSPISALYRLQYLYLDYNRISNISPLASLTNLTVLVVTGNPLTNPAVVGRLTNLTSLYAASCSITNMDFVGSLNQLDWLDLSGNALADLSPLAGLTNLSVLAVNGNSLTNFAALGNLTILRRLDAASCSITNMDVVGSLTRLDTLDLRGNRMADITPGLGLTNLHYLYLDQNRLTNISGLQDLPALQAVSLVQNLLDLSPGSAALTVITNLQSREISVTYVPQNQPPVVEIPASWAVPMNRTSSLFCYVYDDVTPASELAVTAVSGNTNLLPDRGMVLQHDYDATWTLALTPLTGQTGTSTITITVTDDTGFTTTTNLTVTVFYAPAVTIPDPILEAAVRSALGNPAGPLTTFDLESLTSLSSLWNGTITNLAGLEWATNLTSLHLSGNAITSLSPLLALQQLQTLDIGYNNLHDLSPLMGLTNLSSLTLDGNPVSNLGQLAGLPNLLSLSAQNCRPSGLVGISMLVQLQSLFLRGNSLHDPTPLAALTNLVSLDLQDNPLTGIGGLAGLQKLQNLNLGQCSLKSLSGLQSLTNLQYLSLGHNLIRDVSPLAGLTDLVYLYLDSNPVTSVATLARLPRLATLILGNCSLTNLASLEGLTALQSLYLSNNSIRDLTSLAGLTNLSTLYLTGNSPTNLGPLGALPRLSTLDLANCSLSNAASLAPLTHLRSLSLANDFITDISPLTGLTDLYSLYLSGNRLTNISLLQGLTGLRWMDVTRNLLDLSAGSLTMASITNLQARGVWVNYVPQNEPPMFYIPRTNWVIRLNTAADLPLSVIDDVTLPDEVSMTATCSSAGLLSNSTVTLVRTGFYIPPVPTAPILLPPMPIQQLRGGPPPLDASPGQPFGIVPYGGGVSYWKLTVTPPLNQTGTMTLTFTATDDTGLSTNTTILVTVSPPQALDGSWLGATNMVWQTSGNAPWFGQTNVSHSGFSAAQSGSVGVNEESWLETTVTGPGILTFWWKMTATNYGIYVAFTTSLGGELYLEGNMEWQKAMVSIPAGECVLDWRFASTWGADPSDACWLDQVSFVPATPDFWLEPWPGSGSTPAELTIHGEPGGLYELQVSTNLLDWTSFSRLVMDLANGGFTALASDPFTQGSARFYRARQLPADTTWFAPVTFDAGGLPVLQLYGQPGTACEIHTSTDLFTWSVLARVTNTTGTVTFTDSNEGLAQRFYRARQLP